MTPQLWVPCTRPLKHAWSQLAEVHITERAGTSPALGASHALSTSQTQ